MIDGRISIVMPVYNAGRYLQAAIQSVLNQKYTDFEIIAVNDGSKDNSLEILQSFSDPRLHIINKENTGVSDTRNVAIENANGEYVCFLDADDCLSPDYLKRMYGTAKEKNADMVVCNYHTFRDKPNFDNNRNVAIRVENTKILVQAGVLTSAWTKLIKLSILSKYHILFDKNMTFGEDLFFCWKAYLASENIWMIDEKLYGYRMTGVSATSKYHPALYEKYKYAFFELKQFGRKISKDDEYAMDVFFATRMPSFIRMTIRENSSFSAKRKRLLLILNDKTIQKVFDDWNSFSSEIQPRETALYEKCKGKRVVWLLVDGYKKETILFIKNKIKELS